VRKLLEVFQDQGRLWAYTTLQTLLTRLTGKGYARSEKSGTALNYEATLSKEEFLQDRLTALADDVCDGTSSPLMLALVEGGKLSAQEIEQLRAMLDHLEEEGKKPQKGDL
jgi:predicted transcriptional regulator